MSTQPGHNSSRNRLHIAVDAMGGDAGPEVTIPGVALFLDQAADDVDISLFGDKTQIQPHMASLQAQAHRVTVHHTAETVAMDEKPAQAIRRRETSMALAIKAVKDKTAAVAVSAGNTGALMAVAKLGLRTMPGIDRPAICASWPSPEGMGAVLDVGANVECSAEQLVEFAIMGEAFHRAVHGKAKPTVGLLNIGTEDVKGHDEIKRAAKLIRDCGLDMDFRGFVEGDGISLGHTDVIVTDGFTGNVALKTAEGAARLIAHYVREAYSESMASKMAAVASMGVLKRIKERLDPSRVNGGVFLGLNGVVVKSHGGTDAKGFAAALTVANQMAHSQFADEIAKNLNRLEDVRGLPTESVM